MDANALMQRFMLALCVWREARGETPLGRRLVAQVIVNRAKESPRYHWPDSVAEVVLQPMQFSSFNRSDANSTLFPKATDPTWIDCVAAADGALALATPLTPANHYHVVGLDPLWRDPTKAVCIEGHHVFYAL